jgi:hypothetical protein
MAKQELGKLEKINLIGTESLYLPFLYKSCLFKDAFAVSDYKASKVE